MAIDLQAIKAEYNRIESSGGQSNFLDNFVPMPEGEGSVVIRLLPPRGDLRLPFVATRTHKLNGKNIHCPMMLTNNKWQGNCPACNHYRGLWKQSDSASADEAEALQTEARSIKPVERYYWNAIVRTMTTKSGEVQHNVGPKIFSCGKQLQSKLLRAITGDDIINLEGLGDVTDTATGRDLQVIKRLVKGAGNEKYPGYNESFFLNPAPAGTNAQVEEWLTNLHDLTLLRRILPNEEIAREVRVHRGLEQDPDLEYNIPQQVTDEEDYVPPAKPVTKPVEKPRPPATAQVQRPTTLRQQASLPDEDEAMMENDFLDKLRNM